MKTEAAIGIIREMRSNVDEIQWEALELACALLKRDGSDICEPEYLGENTGVGCRVGRCKCGNLVRSYQNFCDDCGIGLEWANTWPWTRKAMEAE